MLSQTFHHHLWGLPFHSNAGLASYGAVWSVEPFFRNMSSAERPSMIRKYLFGCFRAPKIFPCPNSPALCQCVASVQRQTSSVQEWPQPFVMTFNFTGNHYGVITGYDLNLNRLHMWVAEPVLTLTSHWCRISYDWWISELILREALLCRLWRKPVRKWMSKAESSSRTIPSWI